LVSPEKNHLKIQHAPACGIDARHFVFLQKPDDKRSKNVAEANDDQPRERAQMQDCDPLSGGRIVAVRRQWRWAWRL
jgi:hypothetical protein